MKRSFDVVFYEAFKEEEEILFSLIPKSIQARYTYKTVQEENRKFPDSSLVSIRTQSEIPNDWFSHLRGILARTTGYDHLFALDPVQFRNVHLGSLDFYCSRAVAEQAILFMFALLRKLKMQLRKFVTFNRDHLTGSEVNGKTMVVVGVGRIGSEVVDMALGLGMNVLGVDIVQRQKDISYASLKDALKKADVIVVAVPLTDKTVKMLDYSTLRFVRPGCVLINISRGEVTPLGDLKRLLNERILGGLALDVFEGESVIAHALRAGGTTASKKVKWVRELALRDNVLLTPHNAFNTQEALYLKCRLSVDSIVEFFKNGKFPLNHGARGRTAYGIRKAI